MLFVWSCSLKVEYDHKLLVWFIYIYDWHNQLDKVAHHPMFIKLRATLRSFVNTGLGWSYNFDPSLAKFLHNLSARGLEIWIYHITYSMFNWNWYFSFAYCSGYIIRTKFQVSVAPGNFEIYKLKWTENEINTSTNCLKWKNKLTNCKFRT